MFIAVIAGYLVAALFAFCGLASIIIAISSMSQGMGAQLFLTGLCQAAWPLAVGVGIYLLTQIAIMLERQGIIISDMDDQETPADKKAKEAAPKRPAPLPSGSYFHTDSAPRAPRTPAPQPHVENPPSAAPEAPSIAEIKDIASAAAEEAAREAAEPTQEIKPVIKRRDEGLSFFRVD